MVFTLQQRIAIVEGYVRNGSIKEAQKSFIDKYPGTKAPSKRSVQVLVKKWRETGSVEKVQKQRPKLVQTPEVIHNILQQMIENPLNSTRKLSQQVGISRTTCQRVVKSLNMAAYQIKNEEETSSQ